MMKNLLTTTTFCILSFSVTGQTTLVTYDFEGDTAAPTTTNPTVTATSFRSGPGLNSRSFPQGNGSVDAASNSGYGTAFDSDDYEEFCITSTQATGPFTISFATQRSNTGPQAGEVRASTDGFATFTSLGATANSTSFGSISLTGGPSVPPNTQVCFRIYGSGASGSSGTLRFDDVSLVDATALPVSLVSFDATPAGAKANLKWVTASELDNAFFAVEVSRDGVDFRETGRVDGAGTSRESATYGFTYPAPAAGRYYFRLAQHDFDGQVNYSPVVTAELGRGGKKFGIASATYRSDELIVDAEDGAQLRIIDMRGAVISTVKLGAGRQSIDVSGLPAGVYALTDGETAVRFVR